jgi:hypothetical protein
MRRVRVVKKNYCYSQKVDKKTTENHEGRTGQLEVTTKQKSYRVN